MTEENLALPVELLGNVERYAVYRCYSDQGQLLYVGETGDLGRRLADHAKKLWFVQVRGITFEWYTDELDALKAERRAIHIEHPKYNKQHRNTTSAQVSGAKAQKRGARGRLVPATATNDELVTLVLQHVEDADALNSYRVTKVIREQCGGPTVGFNRSKVILDLAQHRLRFPDAPVPSAPAPRRMVPVSLAASDNELAELVLPLFDGPDEVKKYGVNKAIKEARGTGVRDDRAGRILDLARRKHRERRVVAIGERR